MNTHDTEPIEKRALWIARDHLQEAQRVLARDEPRHHILERRKIANALGEIEDTLGIGGK